MNHPSWVYNFLPVDPCCVRMLKWMMCEGRGLSSSNSIANVTGTSNLSIPQYSSLEIILYPQIVGSGKISSTSLRRTSMPHKSNQLYSLSLLKLRYHLAGRQSLKFYSVTIEPSERGRFEAAREAIDKWMYICWIFPQIWMLKKSN